MAAVADLSVPSPVHQQAGDEGRPGPRGRTTDGGRPGRRDGGVGEDGDSHN